MNLVVKSMPSQTDTPAYLKTLNPAQAEAVETLDGPVLVLAGAGTGKTRVLTTRMAHILNTGRAYPGQILAVTFTNKAAREMKERVASLLGQSDVEGWWLGTFHSLAARMLRRHAELVGLRSDFTIVDPEDQKRLIKQLLEAENIDPKAITPKTVAWVIDQWKNRALLPHEIGADHLPEANGRVFVRLYQMYQERLKTLNACDFGDLLLHMITILRDGTNGVQADYVRRFHYILVDEYQDTNVAQYLWLRLLAMGRDNLACVGDDDQAIYSWRGAEVENILRFERDFPNAKVVRLETNYRSTQTILDAANALIARNQDRLGKTLRAAKGEGAPVRVISSYDGNEEARRIGDEIEALQRKQQVSLDEVAVLVRAGFQMRSFEERFNMIGLPYRVVGGPRFYERQEIRDALAYLRILHQPSDDLALERIINVPKRGIGAKTLQGLQIMARSKNISLYDAIQKSLSENAFGPKLARTLIDFTNDIIRWRKQSLELPVDELAGIVLDESGYTGMWQEDKSLEAKGRLENLKELVGSLQEFENLSSFLEHIALVMDTQSNDAGAKATIMTLHGAKGLEFDHVFLPGWEEGLFPSPRHIEEKGTSGLEEERRLAYVGLTRARQHVTISHASSRQIYGSWTSCQPSRFLQELPADRVQADRPQVSAPQERDLLAGLRERQQRTHSRATKTQSFVTGQIVNHKMFGEGKVMAISGPAVIVQFTDGSQKQIMKEYLS